jgi:hypothetical protein
MNFIAAILLAAFAYAGPAPQITGITGASSTSTSPLTIFGGFAGTDCTSSSHGSTCNSCVEVAPPACTTAPLCACNATRAYGTGVLRIDFNSVVAGPVVLAEGATNLPLQSKSVPNGHFVEVTWGELCWRGKNSACETDGATLMMVKAAIDTNSNGIIDSTEGSVSFIVSLATPTSYLYDIARDEGVTDFTVYPADTQVHIEDLVVHSSFPRLGYGLNAKALRVFISDVDMTKATPKDAVRTVDLKIVNGTLVDTVIKGLTNGQEYFFRVALVDQANNAVLFFPEHGVDLSCDSGDVQACRWAAMPDVAVGP